MFKGLRIAVVIPALNEEAAIGNVVRGLLAQLYQHQIIIDQVVVADNGSRDHTAKLATQAGAIVVQEPKRGYGRACLAAISILDKQKTHPDVVVFIDGDQTFLPEQSVLLVEALINGADFVIGVRDPGNMEKGAMTWPQRIGNKLITKVIHCLWCHSVSDLGPYRAIRYDALSKLSMAEPTYGWTVEMQIKAIQNNLITVEIPVTTKKRLGVSKVSGTVHGVIGAALGIFRTIFRLWWVEQSLSVRILKIKNCFFTI